MRNESESFFSESIELISPESLPLVSVIMPTYNCGEYLCRSIDSVFAQMLHRVEIIIVDDASSDNTQEILKKHYGINSSVRVIRQKENKKQGAARNVGLDIAKGKYIFFLDADDWLEEGTLVHLASIAEKSGAEIVACGLKKVWESGKKETYHAFSFESDGGIEALSLFAEYSIGSIACGKLFLREFIEKNNFRFAVPYWHEDVMFTAQAVYACKKYISVENEYYSYFQRKKSTIHKKQTILHLKSYLRLYIDMIVFLDRIKICNDSKGESLCRNLIRSHCTNEVYSGLVRYVDSRLNKDWETECFAACYAEFGVKGYAVADFLIRAMNDRTTSYCSLRKFIKKYTNKILSSPLRQPARKIWYAVKRKKLK